MEHVNVVDQQSLLAGHEQQGFFRGVWDSLATAVGGGRHEIMEPGEYPFSIEVTVPRVLRLRTPARIPGSFSSCRPGSPYRWPST